LGWDELPNQQFPIIFHSVLGKDNREGKNPSFFNPEEAIVVVDYLEKLLNNKQRGMQKVRNHDF
jgi:helicase MOV-10